MTRATLVAAALVCGAAGAQEKVTAEQLKEQRLDLSLPDVPAFTAIGVSPTNVSRPGTVRELGTALSSGVSPDGQLQSGLALEVSPVKLATPLVPAFEDEVMQRYLGPLRLSAASNAETSDGGVVTRLAIAGRYSAFQYDPQLDPSLRMCINNLITTRPLLAVGMGIPVQPQPGGAAVDAGVEPDAQELGLCRQAARHAHGATSGVELAGAAIWSSVGDAHLNAHRFTEGTLWLSAALGLNRHGTKFQDAVVASTSAPVDPDAVKAARRAQLLQDLKEITGTLAIGFEPMVHVRFDRHALTRQNDLFIAARLPLISDGWSLFFDGGVRVSRINATAPDVAAVEIPLGLGGDIRLTNGMWLGLFIGMSDALTGGFLALSSLKWSFGETRPYGF